MSPLKNSKKSAKKHSIDDTKINSDFGQNQLSVFDINNDETSVKKCKSNTDIKCSVDTVINENFNTRKNKHSYKSNALEHTKKTKSKKKSKLVYEYGTDNEIKVNIDKRNINYDKKAKHINDHLLDDNSNEIKANYAKKASKKAKKSRIDNFISKLGKTRIFVEGSNGVRAVSVISKTYKVSNTKYVNNGIEFSIDSKHLSKIIALLNNLCYHYTIVNMYGAPMHIARSLTRVGFVAGLIVVVAMMFVYPQFVTSIDIVSLDGMMIDSTLSSSIYDILSSNGIRKGSFAKSNDSDIAKYILSLDGVSFASLERNGTHISVGIKQEIKNSIVDIRGSRVVSTKLATITRIVVESGTAVKKAGDVVKVGDTIIDGYVVYGDEHIPIEAKGYAYGKVYYVKQMFFANTMLKSVKGESKTIVKMSMFNKIPSTPSSPYENCECVVSVEDYGFLIPFKIYRYTFYELSTIEVENTYTIDEMKAIVYANLIDELSPFAQVEEKAYDISEVENGVYIKLVLCVEELL